MALYLLLPFPSLFMALISRRLSRFSLFILWATTSISTAILMPTGSRDYTIYLRDFENARHAKFSDTAITDPLYASLVWLAAQIGVPSALFYLCFASIALGVKLVALYRLTNRHALPIALYMCSFFFLHEFTQMRAALAIGLWMLGLASLPDSRGRYFALTLLGTFIHIQAALGLFIYPIMRIFNTRWRIHFFASVSIIIIAISIIYIEIPELIFKQAIALIPDPRVAIYLSISETTSVRPNPLSFMSLLAIVTSIIGLLSLSWKEPFTSRYPRRDIFVYGSLFFGSLALAMLTAVPIAAFRISEHFFSLLPVGLWLAVVNLQSSPLKRFFLWIIAIVFLYVFLVHSPYLLDPSTGMPVRDDS